MLYRLSRWTRRRLWRPLRQIAATIHPVPLLFAAALCWLFASKGQSREAYIAYLERPAPTGIAISAAALYVLSAVLYYGNYLLSTIQMDVIYSETESIQTDWRLRSIRNWMGLLCAALPWVGVAAGLWLVAGELEIIGRNLRSTLGALPQTSAGSFGHGLPDLDATGAQIRAAMWLAGVACILVPLTLHPLHRRTWFRCSIAALAGLLCMAAPFLPLVADPAPVSVYAGPVPAAVVIALFAFAVLGTLAWLSRHTGFPLFAALASSVAVAVAAEVPLVVVSSALCALFVALALLAVLSRQAALALLTVLIALFAGATAFRLWSESQSASAGPSRPVALAREPAALFKEWLDKRADRAAYRAADRPYPVFIIATEGGGIYAAAAATTFLSRLQDSCPAFAQHVFAISGVSGGAVGAAIFQSLVPQRDARPPLSCTKAARQQTIETRAARIVLDDHLSPLLGTAVPDLVGLPFDRSRALEASFIRSAERHASPVGSGRLGAPFAEHWSPESTAPALVLNATSVETGYRVAFSPFSFRGQGDRTLLSFSDVEGADPSLSLIRAAVVSARYPGILPAYSLRRPRPDSGQINFVDGGYADDSGAGTALSLYRAIKPMADREGVDLRVILLTSEAPAPDLDRAAGTEARDLIAPLHTLLNVRGLLALQAVTRALAELSPSIGGRGGHKAPLAADSAQWRAAVVTLDQRSFDLPLGWMLSKTTHRLVSLMVGHAELCLAGDGKDRQAPDHGLLIRENSCVMRAIQELLAAPQA